MEFLANLYWPFVLLRDAVLATSYNLAAFRSGPAGGPDLPGALLTLIFWLGGSALLRWVLIASTGSTSIYGPLAAIAVWSGSI